MPRNNERTAEIFMNRARRSRISANTSSVVTTRFRLNKAKNEANVDVPSRARRKGEQEETETDSPEVLDFREGPVYNYSATAHAQIDLLVSQLAVRFHRCAPLDSAFREESFPLHGPRPAGPRSASPYLRRLPRRASSASGELSWKESESESVLQRHRRDSPAG